VRRRLRGGSHLGALLPGSVADIVVSRNEPTTHKEGEGVVVEKKQLAKQRR
jgi:hypothetical protein